MELFERLFDEEMQKLYAADDRDVHDDSKETTLPIAGEIVRSYVTAEVKTPWYIDLLNLNIDNADLETARERIRMYLDGFAATTGPVSPRTWTSRSPLSRTGPRETALLRSAP